MSEKWVSIGGYPPSIIGYTDVRYAKNITYRYLVHPSISGEALKIKFSNWCGKSAITLSDVFIAPIVAEKLEIDPQKSVRLTFGGKDTVTIPQGEDIYCDEAVFEVCKGSDFAISFYLPDFTEMSAGANQSGPFVSGKFSQGNVANEAILPGQNTMDTGNIYFIETILCKTKEDAKATVLFGDSITAMGWPDYLAQRFEQANLNRTVVRRGVSGSRVLREYEAIYYLGYGLKGQKRFAREIDVDGADSVIILHGVNDLIHPDGSSVDRPIEHFPSTEDMIEGFKFYIETAHSKGLKVYLATIMPFGSWRTYEPFREEVRCAVNEWIRNTDLADGVVDLAKALEDPNDTPSLLPEFDSGDHLHPSDLGSRQMANTVDLSLFE